MSGKAVQQNRKLNYRAGSSQAASSLTSFGISVLSITLLSGISFRKWIIYSTGYFLIQSIQRSVYLDNALLVRDESQFVSYWRRSKNPQALIFVPVVIVFLSGIGSIRAIDLLFTLGVWLSLLQDRYRYRYLVDQPIIALRSDFFWLLVVFLGGVFSFFTPASFKENLFLLLIILGPSIGLLVFVRHRRKLLRKTEKMLTPSRNFVRYMGLQVYSSSLIMFLVSIFLARKLSVGDLKIYRFIQSGITPIQSFSIVLLVSFFARSSINSSLKEAVRDSKFFLITNFLMFVGLVLAFVVVRDNFTFATNRSLTLSTVFVALIGPVVVGTFIPFGALLRRRLLGKMIFMSSFAGGCVNLFLLFVVDEYKSVFGIFLANSVSALVTVAMSVVFVVHDFSKKEEKSKNVEII